MLREEEKKGLFEHTPEQHTDSTGSYTLLSDSEKYRLLFDLSPMGITTVDKKGYILGINKAGAELIGYSAEEIIGKNFLEIGIFNEKNFDRISKIFTNVNTEVAVEPFELEVISKEGQEFVVEVHICPLKKNGHFIGIQAIMQNITGRKKAEKSLSEQDLQFWHFFNNANDLIQIVDSRGFFNFVNKKWKDVMEYSDEEIKHLHFTDIIRNDYVSHCKTIFKKLSKGESFTNVEVVFRSKSGKDILLNGNLNAYMIDGHFISTRGIFRDVTNQRKGQKALKKSQVRLQKSEERLKKAQRIAKMGRWDYSHSEDRLVWTDTIYDIFEIDLDNFDGTFEGFLSMVHPDDRNEVNQAWLSSLKDRKPYIIEHRLLLTDNQIKWVREECRTTFDEQGSPVHSIGIVQDITERKRAEAIKDEYQRILTSTLDSVDSLLMVIDKKHRVVLSNWKDHEWVPEEERDKRPYCYNVMKNFESRCDYCPPVKTFQDGKSRRYDDQNPIDGSFKEISVIPIFDEKGDVQYVLENVRDFTDKKMAEETLKEREEKFRLLAENLVDCIWTLDKKLRFTYLSPSLEQLSGFKPDEWIGTKLRTHFTKKEFLRVGIIVAKALKHYKNFKSVTFETKILNKQNKEIDVEITGNVLLDEEGKLKGLQGITRDISVRKKAEEQLQKTHNELIELNQTLERKVEERTERIQQLIQQKDEFINQLGHDLKNPLGPFLQLLPILRKHVSDDRAKQIVDVLDRNANYMKNLVKKTIDLARLSSSNTQFMFENSSLFEIVDEVISVNCSMFDENEIKVENNITLDHIVHVDYIHIQEVFTNLFNNAVKYMGAYGKIIIDAKSLDDTVLVSVKDTGIGVSPEQMKYLFDEYYKADYSRHDFESSGLGLPICKRIIEKHGGRIWAESGGLNKGTTFYFTLKKSNKD